MQIAGIYKNSFVDYPGHIAAVIFTPGCNLDCWYCHNYHILKPGVEVLEEKKLFDFLETRKKFLDGVVLTGGEPLLQDDALDFIRKLKGTGLLIKLDTNGSFPEKLKSILDEGLIHTVAMDIKAPFDQYEKITPVWDIQSIKESVRLIIQSGIEYEFRTTFAPNLSAEDIGEIAKDIADAKKYCIQQYKKSEGMRAKIAPEPHGLNEIKKAENLARRYVPNVIVRGAY